MDLSGPIHRDYDTQGTSCRARYAKEFVATATAKLSPRKSQDLHPITYINALQCKQAEPPFILHDGFKASQYMNIQPFSLAHVTK